MPTPYYGNLPNRLKQTFTRIRRTSGLTPDAFGDATFTESRTTGFLGFVQYPDAPGETVFLGGKEIAYDLAVYTGATAAIAENDVLVFGTSTATAAATRYPVQGIRYVYDGGTLDHKQVYARQEVG